MKRTSATASVAVLALIAIALLPAVYVATEGAWYMGPQDNAISNMDPTYRTVYAPLDAISERAPKLYEFRTRGVRLWLDASGSERWFVTVRPFDGSMFACPSDSPPMMYPVAP